MPELYESLPPEIIAEITRGGFEEQIRKGTEAGAELILPREDFTTPEAIYQSYMVDDEIPTEGVSRPLTYSPEELKAMEEQAKTQLESEIYAAKYPNAPQDVIVEAGKHLDYIFSDPAGFWRDVAKRWVELGGGQPSADYGQSVRYLIIDSIPLEYYGPMFDMLDLNHVIFVNTHIFPEYWDYLNFRYLAGPDNRLEEWIGGQVNYMKTLLETGMEEEIFSFRQSILQILNTHRPDFLNHITKAMQIEFIRNFVPELLDDIDNQLMDETLKEKKARTAMLWIGGVAAGGLILAFAKGKGKTPGPVIITKG